MDSAIKNDIVNGKYILLTTLCHLKTGYPNYNILQWKSNITEKNTIGLLRRSLMPGSPDIFL